MSQKNRRVCSFLLTLLVVSLHPLSAQPTNALHRLDFAGLRSAAQHGQINSVATNAAGEIYLLFDQGDGIRLLKIDGTASTLLSQNELGATGDVGVAMVTDPDGNLYVTGTTTSGLLTPTPNAAIGSRTDTSTNSFVAKFDPNLKSLFVTLMGGSRIAATAVAATADAVFVTGITYAANLPVTPNGLQQTPAFGSKQNGFVEKFSSDGTHLLYATYLTGAGGDTIPAAIVADGDGNAYIAGETSAIGYPTVAALVSESLSNPSGFITRLTAPGDGIVWSTFIPGTGLTSLALDSSGHVLLASGNVALGQFPVDIASAPLASTAYQVLLRLPLNGSTVLSATILVPGIASVVAAAPTGGAWVTGTASAPLYPLPTLATFGEGFALHLTANGTIDLTERFGGLPNGNPSFASLPLQLRSLAVSPQGKLLLAGAVQPTASIGVAGLQTFDLPLVAASNAVFPSSISEVLPPAKICTGSLCAGSAGYFGVLNPVSSTGSIALSWADPQVALLRNLGSDAIHGLQLSVTSGSLSSTCSSTLLPGLDCSILLDASGAGILSVASATSGSATLPLPANSSGVAPNGLVFTPQEIDFGLRAAAGPVSAQTITVSNLAATGQSFRSILDMAVNPKGGISAPFVESRSDCPTVGTSTVKFLAPGATCHIAIAFAPPVSDGLVTGDWAIGLRDVRLSGVGQAALLAVSAPDIDFGTRYANGIRLPRYLYLSNASTSPQVHATVGLPAGSPFTVTDGCGTVLPPASVCRLRVDYLPVQTTSIDSTVFVLDQGLTVQVTGKSLPAQTVAGTTINPNLAVSPLGLAFSSTTPVTSPSSETQSITISNAGNTPFPLTLSLTGDFTDTTSCSTTLAGGSSCSVVVGFSPSQPGSRRGLLAIAAGTATPVYVTLNGTATGILPANNGTLDFGSIPVAQPVTRFYKVSQPFSALSAAVSGPFRVTFLPDTGFGPQQPSPTALGSTASGSCHSCYLAIQFQPLVLGDQTGSLTLQSTTLGAAYTLALTGAGLGTSGLVLMPQSRDFGSVPVHSASGGQVVTLTNLTPTKTAIGVSPPTVHGDFQMSTLSAPGPLCSGTLAFGDSCVVEVQFIPTVSGQRQGILIVTTTAGTVSVNLQGIGTQDPGLSVSPLTLSFSSQAATSQTITLVNDGSAPVEIGMLSTKSSQFLAASGCTTLGVGAVCSIVVTFSPGSASVVDSLSIPVSTPSNPAGTTSYSVALTGDFTSSSQGLALFPSTSSFGPVAVGQQTEPRIYTATNLTNSALTLSVFIPRQFALASAPCTAIAAHASCSFSVDYVPLTNGDVSGTIQVVGTPNNGTSPITALAYAQGYGLGAGTLTVTGGLIVDGVFNFGLVDPGQSKRQTFTVTNPTINSISAITVRRVTSQPPFLSTTTCGQLLAVGQSCTVTVIYSPSSTVSPGSTTPSIITDMGSLTIESDAVTAPQIVFLSGQFSGGAAAHTAPLATVMISQGSLVFGSTAVGDISPAQTVVLANTGSIDVHFQTISAGTDFNAVSNCATLLPGASCTLSVTAAPRSAGSKAEALEIASDAAVSLDFASLLVVAAPSPLQFTPASLDFGGVQLGQTATLPVQVANSSTIPVTFSGIVTTGDYTVSGACPAASGQLAPGSSCPLQISFSPTATGIRAGSLQLSNSISANPLSFAMTGIGTQATLTAAPASLTFGSLIVGTTASASLTLSNSGTATLTGLTFQATADFTVTSPCPVTSLVPGASCIVQVSFSPTIVGPDSGTLLIRSSALGSPLMVLLIGNGLPGGGFTLTVDGVQTVTATVVSGRPASYALAVSPTGSFNGPVVLTCAPVHDAAYASCSIVPATLSLNGLSQSSTVTINTLTSLAATAQTSPPARGLAANLLVCLMLPGLWTLWHGRTQLGRRRSSLLAMVFAALTLCIAGCGGGSGDFNLRYTPTGTYQYQVTATSTSGPQISHNVTLNLIVTSR